MLQAWQVTEQLNPWTHGWTYCISVGMQALIRIEWRSVQVQFMEAEWDLAKKRPRPAPPGAERHGLSLSYTFGSPKIGFRDVGRLSHLLSSCMCLRIMHFCVSIHVCFRSW